MRKEELTIAYLEDHRMVSESISKYLQMENPLFNIIHAKNGLDFINKLQTMKFTPDITLIDLNMPVMDGKQTLHWIKSNKLKTKTLILTQDVNEMNIIELLKLGIDGYLNKGLSIAELGLAIRIVANGGQYYCDDVKKVRDKNIKLMNSGNSGKYKLALGTIFTFKELTILKLACNGLSTKAISRINGMPVRTIDGYFERIYKKTNTDSRFKLMIYAIKNNIIDANNI